MFVGGREIGMDNPPLVIVEIGINHEGEINKAVKMIHDAKECGAECVKFQCHVVDDEMTPQATKIIPGNSSESIYEIMKRCALTEEEDSYLKDLTERLGMIYLSTPFSRAAANRLEEMGVNSYKIGSGECNNYPLVEHIAKFGKPIILSTGMNDLSSIEPCVEIFRKHRVEYALLHCTSMYPTPYDKVRLGALPQLRESFPDAVLGLSDHSIGNYTCFAAVPMGARILEKHYTSDKSWPGPDIPISIDQAELKDLIYGVNSIYSALGGEKTILEDEQVTIDFAYASVVTIRPLKKGEKFSSHNIWVKRPGTGEMLAAHFNDVLGKRATTDLDAHAQLKWGDVE